MTTDTMKVLGGSPYQTDVDESMANVLMVPIGFIEPAADNPRREVGDVKELAESIRAQGILQPLVVCYQDPRATGGPSTNWSSATGASPPRRLPG